MEVDERILRRLRLRDLHTLRAVAEHGSMAQAAESLALSQPAISKSIAEMERVLGVPLLERSPRGAAPTEYGRVLLARGAAVFDELRQGMQEIQFLADPAQGEVRIGTTEPMTAIVAEVVERLSRRYPRMRFWVDVAPTTELLDALRKRDRDLLVTRMAGEMPDPDIRADVLFDDPLAVMADRHHPLARRRRLRLAELLEEPWALPPYDGFIGTFVLQIFRERGLEPPRVAVTTRSVQMWAAMLRSRRFLGIGPWAMLRFPVHYPSLAALAVELPETRRPIALVTLAGRSPAPAARLFAECARAVAHRLERR